MERKIVDEMMGNMFGNYYQVHKLDQKDKDWLKSKGIDVTNTNIELKAGSVFEDWPVGRGVFINDNRTFVIQVNFDEHVKIVILNDEEDI